MNSAIAAIFIIAYAAIALEHLIRINKSASALFGAGLLWTVYAVFSDDHAAVALQLNETLASTAQVIFFLMGAMTIVEVIDAHNGFKIVTSKIHTNKLSTLMWTVGLVTFFLSAILDNLTTTIVMISLLRKLLSKESDRIFFAAIIVIAANAGGAWSPIGDVTTTMLWIGGQVTPLAIIQGTFIPALINLLIPLLVVNRSLKGRQFSAEAIAMESGPVMASVLERNLMFYMGIAILVLVPVFKTVTHLPPFLGILFGFSILWIIGDILHRDKNSFERERLTLAHALLRIDLSSLVFFIGILMAVATLEHTHLLAALATWLGQTVGRLDIIVVLFGLASAVIDNVPLVAASIGMYSLEQYPPDSFLWEFMAYCAGTGGSILIIGSAAGVAAMGLEKIQFIWYLKHISGLALLGYFAGALAYIAQYSLLH